MRDYLRVRTVDDVCRLSAAERQYLGFSTEDFRCFQEAVEETSNRKIVGTIAAALGATAAALFTVGILRGDQTARKKEKSRGWR